MVTIDGRELSERERFLMEQFSARGISDVKYRIENDKISVTYHSRKSEPSLVTLLGEFEKKFNMKADIKYQSYIDVLASAFWSGMSEMG